MPQPSPAPSSETETAPSPGATIMLHVRNMGDMTFASGAWAGRLGSRQWVEGLMIQPRGIDPDDIEYCVIPATGPATEWVRGGSFCGTRGRSEPLVGFGFRLRGVALQRVSCTYRAAFIDGSSLGPVGPGTICRAISGAALEALQIDFQSIAQPVPPDGAGGAEFAASNARFLRDAQAGQYDFLDLGTCDGGGFAVGQQMGGARGLGFEIDPDVVRRNLQAGREVMCADVTTLGAMRPRARFAVCHHVLEHLPNIDAVAQVLRTLAQCCSEFLFIAGPCFDHEDYLHRCGLKAFHSAMLDHPCRFHSIELMRLLYEQGLQRYAMGVSLPMEDSDSQFLVAANAPDEVWNWEALRALPRPSVRFDPVLYRDIVCVVALNDAVDPVEKLRSYTFGPQKVDKVVHVASW